MVQFFDSRICFVLFFFLLLCKLEGISQTKYWVFFSDKGPDASTEYPQLSTEALSYRLQQGIPIDIRDIAVNQAYLSQIQQSDIPILTRSRWLNAVSVLADENQVAWLEKRDFVAHIQPIKTGIQITDIEEDCPNIAQVGTHWRQLNMIGLHVLHRNGWTGSGINIAVFDNGFDAVDRLEGFDHLIEEDRIIATKDFVEGDENLYHTCLHCRHGTAVLSLLAARMPGELIGSSPDANYLLFRTENDSSETHQEEDNWVAAAEYADSIGARIFNTSLGYRTFDPGEGNYSRSDMDGRTAIISLASDIAASKGILVVTSAGNSGSAGISAPADGIDVLAIGAVDECGDYAPFSSNGPSADGRVKPDLAAMGDPMIVLNPDGTTRTGLGTSFAAPMVAGLAACLWQAFPDARREDIQEALKQSASQTDQPDNEIGYGIPNGPLAYAWLSNQFPQANAPLLIEQGYESSFESEDFLIFPNPNSGRFRLAYARLGPLAVQVDIVDLLGRITHTTDLDIELGSRHHQIETILEPGLYVVRIRDREDNLLYFSQKIIVQ